LQSLAPTNPHWAHVVDYGPFSLLVIHKKSLCPNSEDINRLMMMSDADRSIGAERVSAQAWTPAGSANGACGIFIHDENSFTQIYEL
jgi:hypothetical protein